MLVQKKTYSVQWEPNLRFSKDLDYPFWGISVLFKAKIYDNPGIIFVKYLKQKLKLC